MTWLGWTFVGALLTLGVTVLVLLGVRLWCSRRPQ
jgi:hypothetical protein